tara:strand:+ start:2425 stop:3039 length:615 start_codon:yes stop_codon:yes gene_type:complete
MPLLIIDTSHSQHFVIVSRDPSHWVGKLSQCPPRDSAATLLGNIDKCLKSANLDYVDIDAIILATGPGSMTSLRTGISAAQGISMAMEVPVIPIPTLKFYQYGLKEMNQELHSVVVMDGRSQQVFIDKGGDSQMEKIPLADLDDIGRESIYVAGQWPYFQVDSDQLIHQEKMLPLLARGAWDIFSQMPKVDPSQVQAIYMRSAV